VKTNTPAERGILFSGAMVRALLDGSKTQTRRALRLQPLDVLPMNGDLAGREWVGLMTREPEPKGAVFRCKFGVPGDRLWVRETFLDTFGTGVEHRDQDGKLQRYAFAADCRPGSYGDEARKDYGLKWKPSIHMPRAASRILLEIVSVRVERLQDISEAAARAEGIESLHSEGTFWRDYSEPMGKDVVSLTCSTAKESYRTLWVSINGAGSWDANPWVWVVEFKKIAP
jgi:hypothetical protein